MVQILGKSVKHWASNCSSKIQSQNAARQSHMQKRWESVINTNMVHPHCFTATKFGWLPDDNIINFHSTLQSKAISISNGKTHKHTGYSEHQILSRCFFRGRGPGRAMVVFCVVFRALNLSLLLWGSLNDGSSSFSNKCFLPITSPISNIPHFCRPRRWYMMRACFTSSQSILVIFTIRSMNTINITSAFAGIRQ